MKAQTIEKDRKRWYPCPKCKENHPSITTLLDVISSPALMGWLSKNGTAKLDTYHQAALETLEDSILAKIDKLAEQRWVLANQTAFWKSGKEIGKEAADHGTLAHAWIEAHLQGRDITQDSLTPEARNAVAQMLIWEKEHHLETIQTEQTFYNCKLNYAGTADWLGNLDGELSLGDWKTSSGIFLNYIIQGWGYALADETQHASRLYRQIFIGRFGKDASSDVKIFKRTDFPSIEDARDVIEACGHIFARLHAWERQFPYRAKLKKEPVHETAA